MELKKLEKYERGEVNVGLAETFVAMQDTEAASVWARREI